MTPYRQRQLDLMRQMEQSFTSGTTASTIVPMQDDFAHDRKIALTCVYWLPERIAGTIQTKLIEPLRRLAPEYYYYPAASLHLTVQNIRVVNDPPHFSPSDIAKASDVLSGIAASSEPFPFRLTGVLSMPTSVSVIALGTPEYDRFVKRLRKDLKDTGVPDDKTYFTDELVFANITISRYTHPPSPEFLKTLTEMKDAYIGEILATDVSLVTMNAGAHPSQTTVLGTFPFARK